MTDGIRVRPTRAMVLAVASGVILNLLSRVTGGAWLGLASATAFALPFAAALLCPRLGQLSVALSTPRAAVGEDVAVQVLATNHGRRPTPPVLLTEAPGLLDGTVVVLPALPAGGSARVALRRRALARGWQDAVEVGLRATDPFGLLVVRRVLRVSCTRVVHPPRVSLPGPQLLAGRGEGGRAVALPGPGLEVLGLRPWRSGDPARTLHARSSARHGRPVVLEREREGRPAVTVLATGAGRGPAWERAVARACALAVAAADGPSAPALLASGSPRPGAGRWAVPDWFAGLDSARPLDARTLQEALRNAGRGGTVAVLAAAPVDLDAVRAAAASAAVAVVLCE